MGQSEVQVMPIVFIHGVGVGILPYLQLLRLLMHSAPGRPVLFVDVPSVSMRPGLGAMWFDQVADSIAACCAALGWHKVGVVAHSYGSFVTSRVVKRYPALVGGMCIIDPVCLMTCYPQLLANFVYKMLTHDTGRLDDLCKDLIKTFASRDYMVAHTFCRRFRWHELQLWAEQFPARSIVSLSQNDPLVPCGLAERHIQ